MWRTGMWCREVMDGKWFLVGSEGTASSVGAVTVVCFAGLISTVSGHYQL